MLRLPAGALGEQRGRHTLGAGQQLHLVTSEVDDPVGQERAALATDCGGDEVGVRPAGQRGSADVVTA